MLLLLLLVFTNCEKKKEKPLSIPIENTTKIQKEKKIPTVIPLSTAKPIVIPTPTPTVSPLVPTVINHKKENTSNTSNTFILQGLENGIYTADASHNKCVIKESHKAITVISFFTTWCPPCITQLSYLDDLQKRYTRDMLLASVLIHDSIKKPALKALLLQEQIFCFTSYHDNNNIFANQIAKSLKLPKNFSIPLTVIYVKGEYFTHYEGIIPIEMIEYDIKEAQKLLK